jgi:subtilisin family serine protease
MIPLEFTKLTGLMQRTTGSREVKVGLVDGPVFTQHPDLSRENLRVLFNSQSSCSRSNSKACLHGTFVAGILSAQRSSVAPSICPGCTLLIRPIFDERTAGSDQSPSATPRELADAIIDCIDAGSRVINLSLAVTSPGSRGERPLEEALDRAARRGVIVVAAAGNQGTLGSTSITRHPWVIPVVGCDLRGRPLEESSLGRSIGTRGLCAPGESVVSLGAEGPPIMLKGSSVAAPFVTGTIALLWSQFPGATAGQIKLAVASGRRPRQASVVPPVLDAASTYQALWTSGLGRRIA